jgi:hypothetical protein
MMEDPVHGRRTPRFGLQWHITHACDLSCAHCYDRTELRATPWDDCRRVLDELEAFCRARDVTGSVALSGGNPFLHPRFFDVYRAIVERGFAVSLLANPVSAEALDRLVAIRRPAFYQVSLGIRRRPDRVHGGGDRRPRDLRPRRCGAPARRHRARVRGHPRGPREQDPEATSRDPTQVERVRP